MVQMSRVVYMRGGILVCWWNFYLAKESFSELSVICSPVVSNVAGESHVCGMAG